MWNGKNMLDIAASSWNKYITSLMEILFSEEERTNGIIILPGQTTKSKRYPLESERVEILKSKQLIKKITDFSCSFYLDCAIAKAKPSPDKIEQTWKECVTIANRKCWDTKIRKK